MSREVFVNKKDKIKTLVKIADYLDRTGNTEDADFIDQTIQDEIQTQEDIQVDIPPGEYDALKEIYKALGESLK